MTFKTIKKLFIAFIFCLGIFCYGTFRVNADEILQPSFSYLNAAVGETADMVGINYHSNVGDSYVIYGTKLQGNEIESPLRADSVSELWKMESKQDNYGFSERYVCKATLTNLEPNKKYYYQAVSGSNVKSEIKSFVSAPVDENEQSFLFLTDIQSSGSGFSKANNLMTAMLASCGEKKPSLVVMTGDQVDRGGIEQQWKDYYKYCTNLDSFLQATVPGNHEYYLTDGGGYISNEVYNKFYNNPLNGPSDRIGSSYYFMWGPVLFIMLDVVKTTDYNVKAQQKWFRDVVKNNPSQWIIVGSHPGMYSTGAYASDASIMRQRWLKVFEECQVDLAINGHEHIYTRKNLRYGGSVSSNTAGEVDEILGVTYLQGSAAGMKLYSPSITEDYDYVDCVKQNGIGAVNNTGVLITIKGDKLISQRYRYLDGTTEGIVMDEFTLKAKRPAKIENATNQELLDSVTVSHDAETNYATVSWGANLYGNATSIKISGGKILGDGEEITIASSNLVSRSWKAYYPEYNYFFKVEITTKAGEILTKDLSLILNKALLDYEIEYDLDGGINNPNNPLTYKGSDLPITLSEFTSSPTKQGYKFVGWRVNDGRKVSNVIEKNNSGEYSKIKLTAVWEKEPYKVVYDLDGGKNSEYNPTEFFDSSLPVTLSSPSKEDAKFVGWMLNGTIVKEIPLGTQSDVTLTAVWSYKIKYNLDGGSISSDAEKTYTKEEKPTLPTPTKKGYKFNGWMLDGEIVSSIPADASGSIELTASWTKQKGCNKGSVVAILSSITLLVASIFIIRKKH